MHDDRETERLADLVGRVERAVVGRETAVYRMDLQRDRAEIELAAQFLVDRVVQVRVDVRRRT